MNVPFWILLLLVAIGVIGGYLAASYRAGKGKRLFPWGAAVVLLLIASIATAGTATWSLPTTYTDDSPIAPADISRITSTLYYGSTSSGPWTLVSNTAAGATTGTVPDPAKGTTRWYTVEVHLDGMTSDKAVAVSKTAPFQTPKAPAGLSIQ